MLNDHRYHIYVTRLACLLERMRNRPLGVRSSYALQLVDSCHSSDRLRCEEYIDTTANEVNCRILFPRIVTGQQPLH
jgi:hypothetical protein